MVYKDKEKTNVYLDSWVMQDVRRRTKVAGLKLTHYLEQLIVKALGLSTEPAGWLVWARKANERYVFADKHMAAAFVNEYEKQQGEKPSGPLPMFAKVS